MLLNINLNFREYTPLIVNQISFSPEFFIKRKDVLNLLYVCMS